MTKNAVSTLKNLLSLAERRLKVAVELEEKQNFVYPETTEIMKLILKVNNELEKDEPGKDTKISTEALDWEIEEIHQ
jgi:hypothetical protein